MKKLALVTVLVLMWVVPGHGQDSCPRHVESSGGFSVCITVGWEVREIENEKFKLIFGTPGQYFTPNINFKEQNDPRVINDYATASVEYLLKNYQQTGANSLKALTQEPFTTTLGTSGVRVAFRADFKGLLIRTLQYFINGKADQKIIMTGTALEADQATLDPVFDLAAKSFRLDK